MPQSKETHKNSPAIQRSNRYCAAALIFFSLAIFFLTVIVFTLTPQSLPGMLAAGVGVLFMCCCIFCFARYNYFLKQETERL